jgi:hypothetical protein
MLPASVLRKSGGTLHIAAFFAGYLAPACKHTVRTGNVVRAARPLLVAARVRLYRPFSNGRLLLDRRQSLIEFVAMQQTGLRVDVADHRC